MPGTKTKHPPLQVGERIGRWQVLEPVGHQFGTQYWRCRCGCGRIKAISGTQLKRARAGYADGSTQCRSCARSEGKRRHFNSPPRLEVVDLPPPQTFDRVGDWFVLGGAIRHGQRL